MIIRKSCRYIAESVIRNIEVKDDNLDVRTLEKRLSILAIYIMLTVTLVAIGWIFGIWEQLIIATITTAVIRSISGGNHFNSPDLCFVVTTSAIVINPVLQYMVSERLNSIIAVICIITYLIFIPHKKSEDSDRDLLKKSVLVFGILISSIYSETALYTYLILIIDLLINNSRIKTQKEIKT